MNKKLFGKVNGRDCHLYTIGNENLSVEVCDFGATVYSLKVNGTDVALGFNTVPEYIESGTFAGATIGRVANRIAGGKFVLEGKPYFLNKNEKNNHLHGGNLGFDKKLFDVIAHSADSVTMTCKSEDGDERYPGNLELRVSFEIVSNSLEIAFKAKSDKTTLWNPTGHTYFNLDGESSGDCRENLLRINADYYTPADNELIPTGEKKAVKGTPFDFSSLKRISADFDNEQLKPTNGYDHNYILNSEHAAQVSSTKTGVKMDVYTDLPCLQFYSGGAIKTCNGKTIKYTKWAGFCLEPQFCPNAINMNGFEKPIIEKGKEKQHYIRYDFSV